MTEGICTIITVDTARSLRWRLLTQKFDVSCLLLKKKEKEKAVLVCVLSTRQKLLQVCKEQNYKKGKMHRHLHQS